VEICRGADTCLDLHGRVGQQVADRLVRDDWPVAAGGICLCPVQHIFVCRAGDARGGDRGHRTGPRKRLADDQVTIAHGEEIFLRPPDVVEDDRVVLAQPVTELGDWLLNRHTGDSARHEHSAQAFLATVARIGTNDADIDVCAH
jgi:hypothetical protein